MDHVLVYMLIRSEIVAILFFICGGYCKKTKTVSDLLFQFVALVTFNRGEAVFLFDIDFPLHAHDVLLLLIFCCLSIPLSPVDLWLSPTKNSMLCTDVKPDSEKSSFMEKQINPVVFFFRTVLGEGTKTCEAAGQAGVARWPSSTNLPAK